MFDANLDQMCFMSMVKSVEEIETELREKCNSCGGSKRHVVTAALNISATWCTRCGGSGLAMTHLEDRGDIIMGYKYTYGSFYNVTPITMPAPYLEAASLWKNSV